MSLTELACWRADTRDPSLQEIMSWCQEHHSVDRMLVVLRLHQVGNKWRYADPKAAEFFLSRFARYVLTGFQASEWPGTKTAEPGFVFVLSFDDEVKKGVLRIQPSLAKWQHGEDPPLPEDVCLFRESDSHPVLISSTRHLVAWLLTDEMPDIKGFKKTNLAPAMFFPNTSYFCRKYKKRKTGR